MLVGSAGRVVGNRPIGPRVKLEAQMGRSGLPGATFSARLRVLCRGGAADEVA